MQRLHSITNWAIPSRLQSNVWQRSLSCGRTSSTTLGHDLCMMPTVRLGTSKKFLEEHWEQITLHKAAKTAFDEAELQKLPKVKELDAEFAELLTKKKAAYPAYRKARDEMQELKKAQKNVELFFAEEKDPKEKSQTR